MRKYSIFWPFKEWNLYGCSTSGAMMNNPSELKLKDDQYTIALSFIIGITGIEIISLVFGLSIYSNLQSFVSSLFHTAGFVATLFFMFFRTCTDYVWIIFGVCTFIPFLTEIITIFRICLCKRLPAW